MVYMYIGTDEDTIFYGTKDYVMKEHTTRWCMEDVSNEMFEAFMMIGGMSPQHKRTISYMLYNILEVKGMHNN